MTSRIWRTLTRQLFPRHPRQMDRPARKPQLEALEDKTLLSGVTMVPTHVLAGNPVSGPQAGSSTPYGLTPAQVRHAYGFDQITFQNGTVTGNGNGETIAIVDANDDPSIANDLAVFDQTFGLAAPPSFTKVGINASGAASTTTFPTADSGWAGEIELDVEWAHAVAPGASILLVEANSANDTDLLNAVNYARQQPGVVAVSMSWGGSEWSSQGSEDSYFTTPSGHAGVTFFGSAGDNGSPALWPSLSSHVVGVGGTSLTVDSQGNYQGETAWTSSGGSISQYVPQPSYQSGLSISLGGMRGGPDVAYDADPATGVAVYGSYGWGGWSMVGGTSAAAPQWAGLVAITDQGRALAGLGAMDGYTQTLPALYKLPASDFHDITSGSNGGYSAGPGYDLVTGLGSPIANLVVRDLVGGSSTGGGGSTGTNQPPTIATAAHVVSQNSTSASLSVLGADTSGESTLTYTWSEVSGPGSVSFSSNGSNASKNTTATFSQSGTYTLKVTVTDQGGLTATSQVNVTLNQTLTSMSVTPASVSVTPGATQQLSASALDQFGNPMAQQPAFTWTSSNTSLGTVSSSGLFTAGSTTGTVTVTATASGHSASATVSIATSTLLFSDNLENGAGKWSVTSGYGTYYLWTDYATGNHSIEVNNNGTSISRIVAGQMSWTNYSYQATLNFNYTTSGSVSITAREQDNNHLYFFGYSVPLGEWIIAIKNGSSSTSILGTSAPFTVYANVNYTVRADLNGSSLKFYVNNVLQVAVTDSTLTYGQIGFTGTDAIAFLDNVTVTGLSGTQAATATQPAGKASAQLVNHQAVTASSVVVNSAVPSTGGFQGFYRDVVNLLASANPRRSPGLSSFPRLFPNR